MLREVEGLSTAEVAACLDIPKATVKTRVHRARAALQRQLYARMGEAVKTVYPFGFERCDPIVANVLARIRAARERFA